MKIAVITFAYAHGAELIQMVNSLHSDRYQIELHLNLHSRNEVVVAACEHLATCENVIYKPYKVNRGLAKSFNDSWLAALESGADIVINSNDDCLWQPGDLDAVVALAIGHPEWYATFAMGSHAGREQEDLAYCAAAFNRVAIETIGMFDENFFPAYHEDIDYHRRAQLAGLSWGVCQETHVTHAGSGTIGTDEALREQNNETFFHNAQYYFKKWGGDIGKETYRQPFDRFPLYIAPKDRHAPYGAGFDRTDQDIVKL